MKPSSIKALAKLTVGILLLLLVFHLADWRQVWPLFMSIQIAPFILIIVLFPLPMWVSVEKWRSLLCSHDVTVSSFELFRHYWSGLFLNNFMPSNVGGDVGRIALLQRFGRPAEVAASVVVERLTGLFVLLAVGNSALVFRPDIFPDKVQLIFWCVAAGGVGGLLFCFALSGKLSAALINVQINDRQCFGWLITKLRKLSLSIFYYRHVPWVLAKNVLLSTVFYLLSVLGQYLMFKVLALNVEIEAVFFIAAWISLFSLIPLSLNSLGLTEGAFVLLYGMVGVLPHEALAVALLGRFFRLIFSLPGGAFLLFPMKK